MLRRIHIEPAFFLLCALWLLILPIRWVVGAVAAACIHELCHILAVLLTGGEILGISIGAGGAILEVDRTNSKQEAIRAAAGPLGSLFMMSLKNLYPEAAICAAIQYLFNLLPIYPLDGGRILRCLLPEPVCTGIQTGTVVFLFLLSFAATVSLDLGVLPLVLLGMVLCRSGAIKIPCKE